MYSTPPPDTVRRPPTLSLYTEPAHAQTQCAVSSTVVQSPVRHTDQPTATHTKRTECRSGATRAPRCASCPTTDAAHRRLPLRSARWPARWSVHASSLRQCRATRSDEERRRRTRGAGLARRGCERGGDERGRRARSAPVAQRDGERDVIERIVLDAALAMPSAASHRLPRRPPRCPPRCPPRRSCSRSC